MNTLPQDIQQTINQLAHLGEGESRHADDALMALELTLDQLALAYHFAGKMDEPGADDALEPPSEDYNHLRSNLAKRFPMLGLYRSSSLSLEASTLHDFLTGDALDDLTDIVLDLRAVIWRWSNNSEQDALWHFRWGYEHHWGEHLRDLQRYLYLRRFIPT